MGGKQESMGCCSGEVTLGGRMVGTLWVLELLERAVTEAKKRGPGVSHTPTFFALSCKTPNSRTAIPD